MFIEFFFLLRANGLKVTLNEWMTLMEGLEKGLHRNSLTGFYRLSRAVLVKSEADFDTFDRTFTEFFGDISTSEELPAQLLEWLADPADSILRDEERMRRVGVPEEELSELRRRMEQRLKEQESEHNGGNHWIGTGGTSPFGHGGWHPNGIRVSGEGLHRSALAIAGERRYRDFRSDRVLDNRHFRSAFRILRQLTEQNDSDCTELDLDRTVQDTCNHAGVLHLHKKRPRRNAVKVLMLMDSGGSMEPYAALCASLFQAAVNANHFKELHTYYFHNAVYARLYRDPSLWGNNSVASRWLLDNYGPEWKIILVGDGGMDPDELNMQYTDRGTGALLRPALDFFEKLRAGYPYLVWLNPEYDGSRFETETAEQLASIFPTYPLTVDGLKGAMKQLMSRK